MPLPASEKGKGRAGPSAVPTGGGVKAEPSRHNSTGAGASQLTASSDIIELTDDEDDVSVGSSEGQDGKGWLILNRYRLPQSYDVYPLWAGKTSSNPSSRQSSKRCHPGEG